MLSSPLRKDESYDFFGLLMPVIFSGLLLKVSHHDKERILFKASVHLGVLSNSKGLELTPKPLGDDFLFFHSSKAYLGSLS
jgi:hypothetical protein